MNYSLIDKYTYNVLRSLFRMPDHPICEQRKIRLHALYPAVYDRAWKDHKFDLLVEYITENRNALQKENPKKTFKTIIQECIENEQKKF